MNLKSTWHTSSVPIVMALGVAALASSSRAQGGITLVSVSSSGAQGDAPSGAPSISDDGRWIAFPSTATNLVAGDTNGTGDVFLRDHEAGLTTRVSVGLGGSESNGYSNSPAISGNGRVIVFTSTATNLVPMSLAAGNHIYAYDRITGTTELCGLLPDGTAPSSLGFGNVTSNGRYITFIPNIPGGPNRVFARDRTSGTTIDLGATPWGTDTHMVAVSDDLRFLGFNGTGGCTVGYPCGAGIVDRNSGRWWEMPAISGYPAAFSQLSRDGSLVLFTTTANVVPGDNFPYGADVLAFDRITSSLTLISAGPPSGVPPNGTNNQVPAMSADGNFVAWSTDSTNLVPAAPGARGIVLRRRATGAMEVVDLKLDGTPCGLSWAPSISADGRFVVFTSQCGLLVPGDTNGVDDVFVRDRGFPVPAVYCEAKVNSQGCVPHIGYTGTPSLGGLDDFAITASNVRNQSPGVMFWGQGPNHTPFAGGTLCVHPPVVRTPVQYSGGSVSPDCSGHYSFAFTHAYMGTYFLAPGTTLYAQYWQRDAPHPDGTGQGLTDGLEFTTTP